jgi:hypothetical protein
MREDQRIAAGVLGRVREASNGGIEGNVVEWRGLEQESLLS